MGALDPQLGPERRRDSVGISVAVREQWRAPKSRGWIERIVLISPSYTKLASYPFAHER